MKYCVIEKNHKPPQKVFVKSDVAFYECSDCGCIMADIDFYHEQYEADDYYSIKLKSIKDIDIEWGFRWRYILKTIKKINGRSTLLDVGAGNGYFVYLAKKEFGLNAKGLEISKKEIQFAKDVFGIALINEDANKHSMKYDIVTSFNVIEHVADPQHFFSSLLKLLNREGILVITTPNISCIKAKLTGLKNWELVDPPHHINLFTRKALGVLMEKNNLVEIKYETLSTYIRPFRKIDPTNYILRVLFFHLLRILNLGSDHFIVAKKQKN